MNLNKAMVLPRVYTNKERSYRSGGVYKEVIILIKHKLRRHQRSQLHEGNPKVGRTTHLRTQYS